jgi:hypothetical protein
MSLQSTFFSVPPISVPSCWSLKNEAKPSPAYYLIPAKLTAYADTLLHAAGVSFPAFSSLL